MTRLRLDIDHLVLDGFDAGRAPGFTAALEAELGRRLAAHPDGPTAAPQAQGIEREVSAAVLAVLSARTGGNRHG